jgi:uncharacterized protein
VKIEFDENKSRKNAIERDLSFDKVFDFVWETATIIPDNRHDYPEARFITTGFVGKRLHVVCYTPIEGGVRVISFRKANSREIERYVEKTTHQ